VNQEVDSKDRVMNIERTVLGLDRQSECKVT